MEEKYTELRKQLGVLGYSQSFSFESMPLVDNLFADLIQTTRTLRYYMNLSKELIQQRDSLKTAVEPYKTDNARLIKENNKLHINLMHCKEDLIHKIKESKLKTKDLEHQLNDLDTKNKILKAECMEHRLKSVSSQTISSKSKQLNKNRINPGSRSELNLDGARLCSTCLDLKKQLENHDDEFVKYRHEVADLSETINVLNIKLINRDKEIQRLNLLLDGGRPLTALKNDYGTRDNERISELVEKLNEKENESLNLQEQLKEAICKQHEAMQRAVKLAEDNKRLENDLRTTDDMALKLEAECNARLNEKQKLILTMKNQLRTNSSRQNNDEIKDLMNSYSECLAKLETKINENSAMMSTLNSVTETKESLLRDNKDLIDKIRDLEETVAYLKQKQIRYEVDRELGRKSPFKSRETIASDVHSEIPRLLENERHFYEGHLKEIKDKLGNCRLYDFDKVKEERDYYFRVYNELRNKSDKDEYVQQLQDKLTSLERQIFNMQKQNANTTEKNNTLQLQLDQLRESRQSDRTEENRRRINDQYGEIYHHHIDLKMKQIAELQRECSQLKENLKISEGELLHMKTLYNQLKALQMENDKSISEVHAQVFEARREVNTLKTNLTTVQQQKNDLEREFKLIKTDKDSLRENLAQIDHDKDRLIMDVDEKTEKIFSLQHQLRNKDTALELLENKVTELSRKLELAAKENAGLEHKSHDLQTHRDGLSAELDALAKQRDNAVIENRRLQSDIAALTNDHRSLKREYENSRREVEDMKQQLQHYVDEVRRIEDLLSRKEAERTEMLDHFASLSQEATVLETNNHSLETERAAKVVELQMTNSRLGDLETKLKSREALIEMQEEKICALSTQIAALETELTKQITAVKKSEQMLVHEREMSKMLEKQKKSILIGIGETESDRNSLENDLKMLNNDKKRLEETLAKNKITIENLELLLNDSRRENIELKLSLQNATDENQKLARKVDNLLKRLGDIENESITSRQRTEEAAKQLQGLQQQMMDERYQRSLTSNTERQSKKSYLGSGTL